MATQKKQAKKLRADFQEFYKDLQDSLTWQLEFVQKMQSSVTTKEMFLDTVQNTKSIIQDYKLLADAFASLNKSLPKEKEEFKWPSPDELKAWGNELVDNKKSGGHGDD